MALQVGTRLGPYEVLGPIGAGGMGEVYRARDPRLGREVAIKVLPSDRLADEGRRRRFIQEAQAASALNHPHIITIYEVETAADHDFIVMEYVRGKSLDALIPRQGMRLGEALRVAMAVADALAAAHARGIIHRDLKPANVMVGTDGAVKVLDFGLAKLLGTDEASDEHMVTVTAHPGLSAPGTIAGTAAYMAPEQATGGPVDARSDIFAFGAMLYEMVTGARAFAGTSTPDTLTAVIREQPKPPSTILSDVPSDLEKVILRCLRKDPQRRYQHIDDVKVALQDIKEESDSGVGRPAAVVSKRRLGLISAVAAVGFVLIIVAATGWLLLRSPRRPDTQPAIRAVPLTTMAGLEFHPTFSPNGDQVAFTWNGPKQDNWDIYVTLVGSSDVRRLTTDDAEDVRPAWSPDGHQIAFVRQQLDDSTIHVVSPLTGAERRVRDFRGADSIAWSPDSRWLAVGRSGYLNFGMYSIIDRPGGSGPHGIYLIPAEGGDSRALIASQQGRADSNPAFSPDGRRLAYMSCQSTGMTFGRMDCDVFVADVNTATASVAPPQRLTAQHSLSRSSPAWTRDESAVVYAGGDGDLWRVAVDGRHAPERLDIAGDGAGGPALASSRDRLAFTRVWVDADIYRFERGRPAELVSGSSFWEEEPRFSGDGRKVVFASRRNGGVDDIWVADADGANPQQITHGPGVQGSPNWSPDGHRIAFDSRGQDGHFHIWTIEVDGGAPRQLTTEPADQVVPTWSHDGKWIYFSWWQANGRDIRRMPSDGGAPERLTQGADGAFACESADGKSLLFQAKDADSPLMMMPLAGGDARQLVACVANSAFGVGARGVYYVPCDPSPDRPLHVMDPRTGRDERLGTLEGLGIGRWG
jgi:eukaryotic-like serine/threonine-protein kinase